MLKNLKNGFYDFVIYGSIFRCDELLNDVVKYYPRERIIFIDGEDEDFHFRLTCGVRYRFFQERRAKCYAQKGLYYKRELLPQFRSLFRPISFGIPEELIVKEVPENKERKLAFIIPGKPETYIYNDEESYFRGYQRAFFGMTCKKAGWDCLRHYEILANGCVPYFPAIADLPPDTMFPFPKGMIRYTNLLYEKGAPEFKLRRCCAELLEYTRKYLTTKFMAEYLLLSAGNPRQ